MPRLAEAIEEVRRENATAAKTATAQGHRGPRPLPVVAPLPAPLTKQNQAAV